MTSQNPTNPTETKGVNSSNSNETIRNLEQDVASLSYLLSTLGVNPQSLPQPNGEVNGHANENENKGEVTEGELEELQQLEELEELLQRLEGAENIASGVEGRVDALLATLDDLLGTLDQPHKPQVDGANAEIKVDSTAVTEDPERKQREGNSNSHP